jgi:hypothetical protein
MSKILLFEPRKIMQQAIVRALFPAHEVEIAETLPDAGGVAAIKDYDVLIVDGAALREENGLGVDTAQALEASPVAMIWLESEDGSSVANRDGLVVLHRPITRDTLSAALQKCLASSAASSDQAQAEVIDLVDVVDEPTQQKAETTSAKKVEVDAEVEEKTTKTKEG